MLGELPKTTHVFSKTVSGSPHNLVKTRRITNVGEKYLCKLGKKLWQQERRNKLHRNQHVAQETENKKSQ